MATANSPIPPGFVRFKPNWLTKAKQSLSAPFSGIGYDVLIKAEAAAFLEILSPYQLMALSQKLYSLAGSPRQKEARHKKNTVDKYYIPESNTGFSITYEVLSGTVYVTSIMPDPNAIGVHKEIPGVYHVKFDAAADLWIGKRLPAYTVPTKYAAVNGQSNVLSDANFLMAKHLQATYDEKLSEYTLFHNPSDGGMWDTYESSQDKRGNTTGVSKEFSKVLQGVQGGEKEVKWVAHSQGGIIFTEAVRYHLANGGGKLDKNSVTFNAGANNQKKTQQFLPAAGIKILGYNDHPFDFVPQLVGGHASSVSNVVGSVLHAGYVFLGSPQRSPHTLPYQGMDNYLQQMPGAYRAAYKGVKSIDNGVQSAANKTKEAYRYIENIPGRVKVMFKLFKK